MASVSHIDRLPKEIQSLISSWFEQGYTVDEVTEHLKDMGAPISRSSVGRKRKEWGKIIAEVRASREMAEIMGRTFRDSPASEMASASIEMLHVIMQKLLTTAMADGEVSLKPSELMSLAKTISSLTNARKSEVTTTIIAEKAVSEIPVQTEEENAPVIQIELITPDERKG